MKKIITVLSILAMVTGMAAAAPAATVDLSLDPADWYRYPAIVGGTDYNTAPATIVKTAEGNLRGTKLTDTGGTNWIVGVESNSSYNFQNATLRYQWKINGQGSYSGIYSGIHGVLYNFDPNPPSAGFMTTAWSYNGSEVVPSNAWLYTQVVMTETGYQFSVSQTGYGNNDFLYGSKTYGSGTWDALADAHVYFQFGDNYLANAFFEVAAVSITTRDPGTQVPEPATMMLLALGFAGLAGARKAFRR